MKHATVILAFLVSTFSITCCLAASGDSWHQENDLNLNSKEGENNIQIRTKRDVGTQDSTTSNLSKIHALGNSKFQISDATTSPEQCLVLVVANDLALEKLGLEPPYSPDTTHFVGRVNCEAESINPYVELVSKEWYYSNNRIYFPNEGQIYLWGAQRPHNIEDEGPFIDIDVSTPTVAWEFEEYSYQNLNGVRIKGIDQSSGYTYYVTLAENNSCGGMAYGPHLACIEDTVGADQYPVIKSRIEKSVFNLDHVEPLSTVHQGDYTPESGTPINPDLFWTANNVIITQSVGDWSFSTDYFQSYRQGDAETLFISLPFFFPEYQNLPINSSGDTTPAYELTLSASIDETSGTSLLSIRAYRRTKEDGNNYLHVEFSTRGNFGAAEGFEHAVGGGRSIELDIPEKSYGDQTGTEAMPVVLIYFDFDQDKLTIGLGENAFDNNGELVFDTDNNTRTYQLSEFRKLYGTDVENNLKTSFHLEGTSHGSHGIQFYRPSVAAGVSQQPASNRPKRFIVTLAVFLVALAGSLLANVALHSHLQPALPPLPPVHNAPTISATHSLPTATDDLPADTIARFFIKTSAQSNYQYACEIGSEDSCYSDSHTLFKTETGAVIMLHRLDREDSVRTELDCHYGESESNYTCETNYDASFTVLTPQVVHQTSARTISLNTDSPNNVVIQAEYNTGIGEHQGLSYVIQRRVLPLYDSCPSTRTRRDTSSSGPCHWTDLIEMQPGFAGRNNRRFEVDHIGDHTWVDGEVYFNESERKKFRMHVCLDGRAVCDYKGREITTRCRLTREQAGVNVFHQPLPAHFEVAIFVMSGHGKIYYMTVCDTAAYLKNQNKLIQHSSFTGGKPVATAGQIVIVDGEILAIENGSGHYKPPFNTLKRIVEQLHHDGYRDAHDIRLVPNNK